MPAFALRQWRTGGNSTAPVFVTWLPGVGRYALTLKHVRHSLRDGGWYMDTRAGPRSTQSPLEHAKLEALRVSETLRRRLRRSVPVSPALAFPDTKRDRGMERLAGPHFRQPLTERTALAEIAALLERPVHAGVGTSHARGQEVRPAPAL